MIQGCSCLQVHRLLTEDRFMIPESLEAATQELIEGRHQSVDLRDFAKGIRPSTRMSLSSGVDENKVISNELVSFQSLAI
jgi:hypothetical protein